MKNLLKSLLTIKQDNMLYSIFKYVESFEELKGQFEIFQNENYLFLFRKKSNILLVSHIDTIKREDVFELIDNNKIITAKNSVLGADDRAGNAICLSFLHNSNCSFLFTNLEESGCIGAKNFINNFKEFLIESNINIYIELDRRGSNDYVNYGEQHDYEKIFVRYGFNEERGSCSDVKVLTEETNIPHVNLSVGYYNEHTKNEYIDIMSFHLTRSKLKNILEEDFSKRLDYKAAKIYSTYYANNTYWGRK
jgi:putative aminopeptidase FrvX